MAEFKLEDYGAVGDGMVDDTDAITAAFNAAETGDVLVVVPGKTYRTTRPIQVPRPVNLANLSIITEQ